MHMHVRFVAAWAVLMTVETLAGAQTIPEGTSTEPSGAPQCSSDWVSGWHAAFETAGEALLEERNILNSGAKGHIEALELVSSVAYEFRQLRVEYDLPEPIDRSAAEMEILLQGYALSQFVFHYMEAPVQLRTAILEIGIKLLSSFGQASETLQEWRKVCG